MKKTLYILFLATAALWGCKQAEMPDADRVWTLEEVGGTPITIEQAKWAYRGQPTSLDEDLTIYGRVVSSDEWGNFYRSIYIQDETSGIEVKIGPRSGLYTQYHLGQEVFVKIRHLTLGGYHGMISVGNQSGDSQYENTWLDSKYKIDQCVFKGQIYSPLDPIDLTSSDDLTELRLGCYVRLVGATYQGGKDDLTTWAYKPDPNQTNDTGAIGTQYFALGGVTLEIRTSGYAKFAGTKVPFTVGQAVDIAGILSIYNSTWQLILNTDADAVAQ